MHGAMTFETRGLTKVFLANFTGEGLLLGMRSFVNNEIGFSREVAATLSALKRPRAGMRSSMDLQILHHGEGRRTNLASSKERISNRNRVKKDVSFSHQDRM